MFIGQRKGFDMPSIQHTKLLLCAAAAATTLSFASSAQAAPLAPKECSEAHNSNIIGWQFPCAETQPTQRRKSKKRLPPPSIKDGWKDVVLRGPAEGGSDGGSSSSGSGGGSAGGSAGAN